MARQSRKKDSIASTARLDMPQTPESNGSTALLDAPVASPPDLISPAQSPERFTNLDEAEAKAFEEVAKVAENIASTPAEPAKPEPTDRERELQAWHDKVVENAERVEQRNQTWKELAAEAKEAKEAWESAVNYGQAFIRTKPTPMPLFDKPPHAAAATNGEAKKPRKPKKGKATEEPLPAGDDAWRSVSVSSLELSAGLCSKLVDAGLGTMGALADFTKTKPTTDIPGIGNASAGAIDAATQKFWEDRRFAEVAALRAKEEEAKAAPAFDLDALRLKHVSELPLPKAITDYLDHVGIRTVGSLADWPEKTGSDYTHMNGVAGPAGADIASAVAIFLKPPVAEEPAPEPEPAPLEAVA